MKIKLLTDRFCVCKTGNDFLPDFTKNNCFFAKTEKEVSFLCPVQDAPSQTIEKEGTFFGFYLDGTFDFSLVGILSRITSLLADEKIPVFAVSTYDTDYLFVKEEYRQKTLDLLLSNGYEL